MDIIHHTLPISIAEARGRSLHNDFLRCWSAWILASTQYGSDAGITETCGISLWGTQKEALGVQDVQVAEVTANLFTQSPPSQLFAVDLVTSYVKRAMISPALGVRYLADLVRAEDDTVSSRARMRLIAVAALYPKLDELTLHAIRTIPPVQPQAPLWGPSTA